MATHLYLDAQRAGYSDVANFLRDKADAALQTKSAEGQSRIAANQQNYQRWAKYNTGFFGAVKHVGQIENAAVEGGETGAVQFAKGGAEAVVDTVKGAVGMAVHPVDTAVGIGHAFAHPIATGKAVVSSLVQTAKDLASGDPEKIGKVYFNLVLAIMPGAGEAGAAEKAANALEKVEKAAGALEKVEKAAGALEKAEKAGGALEKAEKAAGAIEKTADETASVAGKTEKAAGAAKGGADEVTSGAKRGPKTDPDAPHNAKIRSEAGKLEADGNEIVAGGGEKETLVKTPGGAKEGRRPDIIYKTPEGELKGRNIGRTKADGTPVTREQQALKDLNGPGKLPTDFVPYDR